MQSDLSATVTVQDVVDQMKRIMVSPEFAVPARAKKFLQYLVDETLGGRADRIKAYSVAIEVFGRDASFDAQNDPAVRIEAARLRRGLERYYLTAGTNDPVVISIPKGGYVPQFDRHNPSLAIHNDKPDSKGVDDVPLRPVHWKSAAIVIVVSLVAVVAAMSAYQHFGPSEVNSPGPAAITPVVIVNPLEDHGMTADSPTIARGLTLEIIDKLAKFNQIIVAASTNPEAQLEYAQPQFELVGAVRTSPDLLSFSLRLQKRNSKQVIWSKTYEDRFDVVHLLDFQKRVATEVATELGQAYGVIIRSSAQNLDHFQLNDRKAYLCTLSALAYRYQALVAEHARVRECLEETVARFPDYIAAWAQLALIYLDEDRFGYNPRMGQSTALERATVAANKAFALDPNNLRALEVMMTISYFNGNLDLGKMLGERGITLNPNDMSLVGEYGFRLVMSGDWKTGLPLIEKSKAYRLDNINYLNTSLAVAAFLQRDLPRAVDLVKQVDAKENPIVHLVAAAIYGQSDMATEAKVSSDLYVKTNSKILENIDEALSKRNFKESDKAYFIEGLQKAGLPVPAIYLRKSSN